MTTRVQQRLYPVMSINAVIHAKYIRFQTYISTLKSCGIIQAVPTY